MDQMRRLEANVADSSLPRKPGIRDFTPAGQAFPYRLLPMKQWQRVWSLPGTLAHGAPPCGCGARMSGLRAKISTMIIAAPHFWQTKLRIPI